MVKSIQHMMHTAYGVPNQCRRIPVHHSHQYRRYIYTTCAP